MRCELHNSEIFQITTKVPDWAEKILRKPPEWRSVTECNKLHALLRPLKSFEKFTEKIQMAMCRSMRYELWVIQFG